MNTGNARLSVRLSLISILVLLLSFLLACSKGGQTPENSSAPAVNPYSNESVFNEVQRKVQENPNDTDALYHLADLYFRNAQYKEAIETYKKVLKLKPDLGYAYLQIGTAYDRMNQPAEAVTAFHSAIKYMPAYAVAYNNLGIAYGKLNKLGEEVNSLKRAISLRPRYASARYNLGVTYLKMGNKKLALSEYEALKDFDEGTAEALMKEIQKTP
jgi:tetratricopeptide (TPR) repeat protein